MARRTLTEKILIVIDGLIKESAAGLTYPHIGLGKYFKKYHGSFYQAIYDLKKRGYLEEVEDKGKKFLKLTSKGRLKIIKKRFLGKWDGSWRIVAFDIPEKRKKTRDLFRFKLSELGGKPIQKSVWITPNDISSELEDLLDILNLEENVDYFISKAVTNEEKYMDMFGIDSEGNKNSTTNKRHKNI